MSEPLIDAAAVDAVTDIVVPTTTSSAAQRADTPESIPMDPYVRLLAEERECADAIKWWTKRRELVKEQLTKLLGDAEVGTVNGEQVVFYEYQDRFNSTEFRKKYPDLFRVYSREVTKTEFDAAWLKSVRPDLYREFQVRPMRVTYEAPGASSSGIMPPTGR